MKLNEGGLGKGHMGVIQGFESHFRVLPRSFVFMFSFGVRL